MNKNKVNNYYFSQGAKNHGVIMPDANKEATLNAVSYLILRNIVLLKMLPALDIIIHVVPRSLQKFSRFFLKIVGIFPGYW